MPEYPDPPKVNLSISEQEPSIEFLHLDDCKSRSNDELNNIRPHIYTFENEEREDELLEFANSLVDDFIFTTTVVWPNWMNGEVKNLDTEVLKSFEWMIAMGAKPKPDDVEVILHEYPLCPKSITNRF